MPQSTPRSKPDCQFDNDWAARVSRDLDLINEKLDAIMNMMEGKWPIIPELEHAVRRNARISRHIDKQVPDNPKPKGK